MTGPPEGTHEGSTQRASPAGRLKPICKERARRDARCERPRGAGAMALRPSEILNLPHPSNTLGSLAYASAVQW